MMALRSSSPLQVLLALLATVRCSATSSDWCLPGNSSTALCHVCGNTDWMSAGCEGIHEDDCVKWKSEANCSEAKTATGATMCTWMTVKNKGHCYDVNVQNCPGASTGLEDCLNLQTDGAWNQTKPAECTAKRSVCEACTGGDCIGAPPTAAPTAHPTPPPTPPTAHPTPSPTNTTPTAAPTNSTPTAAPTNTSVAPTVAPTPKPGSPTAAPTTPAPGSPTAAPTTGNSGGGIGVGGIVGIVVGALAVVGIAFAGFAMYRRQSQAQELDLSQAPLMVTGSESHGGLGAPK